MSKKNKRVLQEGTIRRFMKLASIGGLSDGFLTEEDMAYKVDDEIEVGVEIPAALEGGGEDLDDEDEELGEEPGEELAVEEPAVEEPVVSIGEDEAYALVDAMAQAVSDVTGHDITAERETEGEPEVEAGLEAETEEAGFEAEAGEAELGAETEEEDLGGGLEEGIEADLQAANINLVEGISPQAKKRIIQEVTKRVARRLLRASAKQAAPERRTEQKTAPAPKRQAKRQAKRRTKRR